MSKWVAPAALFGVAGVVVFGLFAFDQTALAVPLSGARLASGLQIDGPPLGHTGGFGEPTCAECHVGSPLNEPGSTLDVIGLDSTFQPGAEYRVTVRLRSFDMLAAGFQATLRWDGGPNRGGSAGELRTEGERTTIVADEAGVVAYAQHTALGTEANGDTADWVFYWTAPTDPGSVLIHVAANSGNGDNSPLEDLIYTRVVSLQPARDR